MEDFERKNGTYKNVMLVIITAFITALSVFVLMYNYYIKSGKGINEAISNNKLEISESTANLETKIETLKKTIDTNYLGEIDENKLIDGALKGYVEGLGDEYTEYLTKDDYDELMISVSGNYVGIGIYMSKDKYDNIIILMPIEGTPAEEAGLKTGDIITKINGEDCAELDLNIVASRIKGEEGTTVELEILRGNDETFTKTLTRRNIEIKDMESEVLDNNIGYIKILSFDDECADEFRDRLIELKNKGIKSLIIDVRDNGGGTVSDALKIADMLIDNEKDLMITVDKNGNEIVTKSKEENLAKDLNLVILANENSASASEILVGALKDNGVAKVVGVTTFGKGVMQEIAPIPSIGGALKVTIQEFKTPNGNAINKKGIEPDVEVNDTEEESDVQLNKAKELLK